MDAGVTSEEQQEEYKRLLEEDATKETLDSVLPRRNKNDDAFPDVRTLTRLASVAGNSVICKPDDLQELLQFIEASGEANITPWKLFLTLTDVYTQVGTWR